MENKSKVLICGDIHGYWRFLNTLINKKQPEILLQCGDFGWWPEFHDTRSIDTGKYEWVEGDLGSSSRPHIPGYSRRQITARWNQYGIKNPKTLIYFCDGNHEDHDSLDKLNDADEIMPGVFFKKRSSMLTLPDGRTVLFIGGADSIDKKYRTQGVDWFPQEMISYRDIDRLPDCKIDIVISHTCPEVGMYYMDHMKETFKDSSRAALDYVLERYNPSLWFFGHFHQYKKFQFKDTVFYALDMAGVGRSWWTWLPR